MRTISRFPVSIAASACLLLALGFFLGHLTREPQGGRVPRLSSQNQNLSKRKPLGIPAGGYSMGRQREEENASRKMRAGNLLRQAEQIMQAPGERAQDMDLFAWVNQLGEEDLAILLEQTLSGDREIAEAWGWWGKGGAGDYMRGEVRNIILTRWARLNPEKALSVLTLVDEKTADFQQIGRISNKSAGCMRACLMYGYIRMPRRLRRPC